MTSNVETKKEALLVEIQNWLEEKTKGPDLARRLGVTGQWVDEFETAVRNFKQTMSAGKIELLAPSTGEPDPVGDDEEVAVLLHSIEISRLFTDDERGERGAQEGTVFLNFNGQVTTIAWKRPAKAWDPWGNTTEWEELEDKQKRLLFVGKPVGLLDIDAVVEESDAPERAFFLEDVGFAEDCSLICRFCAQFWGAGLSCT